LIKMITLMMTTLIGPIFHYKILKTGKTAGTRRLERPKSGWADWVNSFKIGRTELKTRFTGAVEDRNF
jgi:hypothetical protein